MAAVGARERLLRELRSQGITDPVVLAALGSVRRELFVPDDERRAAYDNVPLPIGWGQTISQPFIVAYMIQAVAPVAGDRALDVGAGSGYQAAVLAACGAQVTAVEIVPRLAALARANLAAAGVRGVEVHQGDGSAGWVTAAPYDVIVVAAVSDEVPKALLGQLRPATPARRGGRLILPVRVPEDGWTDQRLVLFENTTSGMRRQDLLSVRFVPLVRGDEGRD